MKRREAALERWCVRWARARGVVVSKLTDPTGIPDRVFWVPGGRPILIEFKAPSCAPTELQMYYLKKFTLNGYRAVGIWTKEQFLFDMKEAGVKNEQSSTQFPYRQDGRMAQ
jgi:hypothetical protein